MDTPICDYVDNYIKQNAARLHMPGHKGISNLGCEPLDITEITGADSLYEARGIIQQSENNAGMLFNAQTFYSTEGSSHTIRAMLSLACQYAKANGKKPVVWAGRNAHSAFISAVALLDISLKWLYSEADITYISCPINAADIEHSLKTALELPTALYITSPDYLGNQADIKSLSMVCHKYGVLLLVDNAHGAYLKFLPQSTHPIDLGADICCDSAHKTLPVLTGGAYLHISKNAPVFSVNEAREALRLFGSTSPSYLILQSLDMTNRYLAESFPSQLLEFVPQIQMMKNKLTEHGYTLIGTEPLKLTIYTKPYGYSGTELAELLAEKNIIVEFSDPDYVVMMLTPLLGKESIDRTFRALTDIHHKIGITESIPKFSHPKSRMSIRQAVMSPFETIPIEQCCGKTLARASVSCPPAVPILVCGEIIDENAIDCFRYYGIKNCNVVKE